MIDPHSGWLAERGASSGRKRDRLEDRISTCTANNAAGVLAQVLLLSEMIGANSLPPTAMPRMLIEQITLALSRMASH